MNDLPTPPTPTPTPTSGAITPSKQNFFVPVLIVTILLFIIQVLASIIPGLPFLSLLCGMGGCNPILFILPVLAIIILPYFLFRICSDLLRKNGWNFPGVSVTAILLLTMAFGFIGIVVAFITATLMRKISPTPQKNGGYFF
jgi:phosphoglycerol transferase MdoB-like AlkP superfamily enzyme